MGVPPVIMQVMDDHFSIETYGLVISHFKKHPCSWRTITNYDYLSDSHWLEVTIKL